MPNAVERLFVRDEDETVDQRLRHQHPIERIAVQRVEAAQPAQAVLGRDLSHARRRYQNGPLAVGDRIASGGRRVRVIDEPPQERMRVEQKRTNGIGPQYGPLLATAFPSGQLIVGKEPVEPVAQHHASAQRSRRAARTLTLDGQQACDGCADPRDHDLLTPATRASRRDNCVLALWILTTVIGTVSVDAAQVARPPTCPATRRANRSGEGVGPWFRYDRPAVHS